jgi:hypothetical protein
VAFYPHRFTGIGATTGDGAIKNPGMAAQQGSLFTVAKSNYFHAAIVTAGLQQRRYQPQTRKKFATIGNK